MNTALSLSGQAGSIAVEPDFAPMPLDIGGWRLTVVFENAGLAVLSGETRIASIQFDNRYEKAKQRTARLAVFPALEDIGLDTAVLALLQAAFSREPELRSLDIVFGACRSQAQALLRAGIGIMAADNAQRTDTISFPRSMFWQQQAPFLCGSSSAAYPYQPAMTDGRRHPLRPPRPEGAVYRRFIPSLNGCLTLRTVDMERDLPVFHEWMNNPRVNRFWEESGTVAEHRSYLAGVLARAHTHPLIGYFNDKPFGYFEAYWAKEDRIAPFSAPHDYDRGMHMLIGDESFRGPACVGAWLPSLAHYLFLDDPRTETIVCEPRHDNDRMIAYLQRYGFARIKHFDFPHKRAALMILQRESFFGEPFL